MRGSPVRPNSVVLAHGRAAEFEIPALQSQQWSAALRFALQRVGSEFADDLEVDYASFGDLWRPDVSAALPEFTTRKGSKVKLAGDPPTVEVTPAGPAAAGGFGVLSAVADALLPDLVLGTALRAAIPDVFDYLEDAEFREATNERLRQRCIDSEAAVLVGFSMGTIVGYEVLRTAGPDFPVTAFISVGSPLALGPVRRALADLGGGRTDFPPHVRLWLNVWNESDVATGIHGNAFAATFPDPQGRRVQQAQNFGRAPNATNPFAAHDALDYLSSLAVGTALHTALLDLREMKG
jgi:hypothetical protein